MAESLITKYLDAGVLNRLMAQPLLTALPMQGSVSGHHKSPHRGSSVEFAEYRNYVPGDDIRRLDWRVFGRTDRFYLKEFEAETNLRCYLVLDCSASMNFAGKGEAKIELAKKLIATLAYLVIHQGDAVGLLTVGDKSLREIPARRSPSHLQVILESLDQTQATGTTGLAPSLHELAERVRPRGMVIVFSDLFSDPKLLLDCFRHLRFQKHDVAVFHLLDPMETKFEFDRPVRFSDLESSTSIVTEPAMVREEYLAQFNAFLEQMRSGCHEFNADYRQVMTTDGFESVLASFLVERNRAAAFR